MGLTSNYPSRLPSADKINAPFLGAHFKRTTFLVFVKFFVTSL
jgi:hypothetical protein